MGNVNWDLGILMKIFMHDCYYDYFAKDPGIIILAYLYALSQFSECHAVNPNEYF